jgi:hypothetical protein
MTYTEQDERELLIGLALWLSEHDWITVPHAKLMWLVEEFIRERKDAREWGK